ncbi:hypothetical protein K7432_008915 [Basidiobolus ranarum]|uniref:Uncharacterized protein n=1 Tax=Basidiobolus ranarum TaxID=34480 RepID=A0ABR2VYQ3_9FUNG
MNAPTTTMSAGNANDHNSGPSDLLFTVLGTVAVFLVFAAVFGIRFWKNRKQAQELKRRVDLTLDNLSHGYPKFPQCAKLPSYTAHNSQTTLPLALVESITKQMRVHDSIIHIGSDTNYNDTRSVNPPLYT